PWEKAAVHRRPDRSRGIGLRESKADSDIEERVASLPKRIGKDRAEQRYRFRRFGHSLPDELRGDYQRTRSMRDTNLVVTARHASIQKPLAIVVGHEGAVDRRESDDSERHRHPCVSKQVLQIGVTVEHRFTRSLFI